MANKDITETGVRDVLETMGIPTSFAGLKQGIVGRGEMLATMGSGIGASAVGGLAGLGELARTRDLSAAVDMINQAQEALTYQPRTQIGAETTERYGSALEALAAPSEFVGEKALEITGSPAAATAAEILLDPLSAVIPGISKVGKVARPKASPALIYTTRNRVMRQYPELFNKAKSGDIEAAYELVENLIDTEKAKMVESDYVLPIVAEEMSGRNAIPLAIASYIGDVTGIPVDTRVVQANRVYRTGKAAADRIFNRPEFSGKVDPVSYTLIDDHITQGGTLGGLRDYITEQGGQVQGYQALTASAGSSIIDIMPKTKEALVQKFGRKELGDLLREFPNAANDINRLTESEAQYLLKFKSLDSIRNKLFTGLVATGIAGIATDSEQAQAESQVSDVTNQNSPQ